MEKMELLSPAGNYEKLETVFLYGADAAYMGLKDFSLRTNADNFDYSDAERVNSLKARCGGKKLYCAVNIFFHEADIELLERRLADMKNWNFDGFIISDIGIVDTVKKAFPEAELHLSTQASCINASSASMYRRMGFDRIIMGRETPLADIRRIKDANPDLSLEVFVHGAMCMAYSGRCFLSSHLTGRSANQGDCSHTCRWNYRLALEEEERSGVYYPVAEENGFTTILSSKDLCMIDHLDDLRSAGVDSLKIEGRMKSVYYAATVTRAYRKALDNLYYPDVDFKPYRDELFNVSHREFSTGFFYGSGPVDTANDINVPAAGGYLRDYIFLGTVGSEVKPGIWSVDIKNQIRTGDRVEFIGPDVFCIEEPAVEVLDGSFMETEHIDHCRTGYIKTTRPLKKGYIIRRELAEKA